MKLKMNKEELELQCRKLQEERQNKFIDVLYEYVLCLCENAMKKSYTPTDYERARFHQMLFILNDMKNWF